MKEAIYAAVGVAGAAIASAFGGWNAAMTTLLIFMGIDYLSGIIVAGVFNNSPKTENGALESRAGWKGLLRKGMSLLLVLIGARIDIVVGTHFCKDAVAISLIMNELLSIIENAGLMGVPVPAALTKAIEILKQKEEKVE